ncbi:hypothetical protein [Bacillus sp. S/N-304-OC-R1]|uniref:hypothetical protein n=1 Tax=Bacillus sp. S/N-304-OC-R1 TaxID=2758034 RepID=UPI001C8E3EC1|nr:hypothetical protein [Bacillus sp. S/N-304-OC-R1]MBY0120667.1 hypothetical protein [Bacillus sp. S/N-304-OC-R1]
MTTFLLLISLFLNVLALFSIIILFLRQNKFLLVEKNQEQMMQEMEEVISAYLVQMKEENEEFLKRMSQIDNKSTISIKEESDINFKEEIKDIEINGSIQGRVGKANIYNAAKAYKQTANIAKMKQGNSNNTEKEKAGIPPLDSEVNDLNNKKNNSSLKEDTLINEILLLKKQGLNETEIAQKLNKGKTEIALLLKFNQNSME